MPSCTENKPLHVRQHLLFNPGATQWVAHYPVNLASAADMAYCRRCVTVAARSPVISRMAWHGIMVVVLCDTLRPAPSIEAKEACQDGSKPKVLYHCTIAEVQLCHPTESCVSTCVWYGMLRVRELHGRATRTQLTRDTEHVPHDE